MILNLLSTDKLQVVTGSAATVDSVISFMDASMTDPPVVKGSTSGTTVTAISTATTTDVVAAPAASHLRGIKSIHLENKSASVTTDVTVLFNRSATTYQLRKATLAPGEQLEYIEGIGWFEVTPAVASAASGAANTTGITAHSVDTYYLGMNIAGRIQAGSFFRWYITASKGAAGTAAPTFIIRTGTAGTVSDTARLTMTGPAQSAVADTARIRVEATFRTVGATAVIRGDSEISHNLAATGFATTGPAGQAQFGGTSASFDVTPSGTILGLSVNPGTSGAWVVDQVTLDAVNLIGS